MMKRILSFTLFLFAATLAASATSPAAGPMASFPAGISGEYAIYRDWTWKTPTWVGFLQYDESTYGALAVTPDSGANVSILFRCETVGGKMVLTGQQIISKITQADVGTVNYLMSLLPDLYAWRTDAAKNGTKVPAGKRGSAGATAAGTSGTAAPARSPLLPEAVRSALKADGFGGDVVCLWAPEVPVFNLASMTGADGKPRLSLERTGRIQAGGEGDFFGFKPLPDTKQGVALTVPAKRRAGTKTVDGVKLNLDDQWKQVADNTFLLGNSAVLIVDTLDIALMQIPRENLALSLVRLFSPSSATAVADPAALSVTGTAKRFRIVNRFRDVESGTENRDLKLCVPSADGKKCAVASLSVNETAYLANKAYFDSLF